MELLLGPFRIVPNDALLPARENGVEAGFVPNTLDVGAPKAAKSETTLREGDGLLEMGDDGGGVVGRRAGA